LKKTFTFGTKLTADCLPEIKKYSEEELVMMLQNKDQQAFSYLYDNYSAALNGIIYRLVENRELAEDILQEAFVKIWNNFSSYDMGKGRLFTWMLNITRNLTIDTLRSKGYKKQAKISSDENSVSNFTDDSRIAERFDAMGLRKQLANLKPEQRSIIDLAYFHGYTQDEISKEMNIPLGTVKTRMRSAIIELRKMLEYT
jgi:RNA polymerase sigma-70 factor (ECF subfamily)